MKYQIVTKNADGFSNFAVEDCSIEDFIASMAEKGYKFSGLEDSRFLRQELIGQPKFSNLVGPMYGGQGVTRYENQSAYDTFSN